jgi:hypothetical protein
MSALELEEIERVRAEAAVELIDCGRASERTKGTLILIFTEHSVPPMNYFPLV